MLDKIISGGQTGVDTAALDVAIALRIPHGGRCPKGRLRENGIIPLLYTLKETESSDYSERTKLNIQDSDGTLIFLPLNKIITDGTRLTIQEAEKRNKPHLIIYCFEEEQSDQIKSWLNENNIGILNIAGPRESQAPGIYTQCYDFLYKTLETFQNSLLNNVRMR
jgi:Circularly permutated YpsA SLOG family